MLCGASTRDLEAEHAEADELPDDIDSRLGEIEAAMEAIEQRPAAVRGREPCDRWRLRQHRRGRQAAHRPGLRPAGGRTRRRAGAAACDEARTAFARRQPSSRRVDSSCQSGSALQDDDEIDDPSAPLSDRLLTSLSAHRTLALADALADDPAMAFLAALHALTLRQFYRSGRESCIEIEPRRLHIGSHVPGLTDTPYARAFEARTERWAEILPSTSGDLWHALVELDRDSREALFAHCIALTLNAVHEPYAHRSSAIAHADQLATSLDLDMAKAGWKPTADTYLAHVTKARILDAVRDAKDDAAADRLAGLKKPEMIAAAEDLLAESGWLPDALRTPRAGGGTERPGENVGREVARSAVDHHDAEHDSGGDTDPAAFATAAE